MRGKGGVLIGKLGLGKPENHMVGLAFRFWTTLQQRSTLRGVRRFVGGVERRKVGLVLFKFAFDSLLPWHYFPKFQFYFELNYEYIFQRLLNWPSFGLSIFLILNVLKDFL